MAWTAHVIMDANPFSMRGLIRTWRTWRTCRTCERTTDMPDMPNNNGHTKQHRSQYAVLDSHLNCLHLHTILRGSIKFYEEPRCNRPAGRLLSLSRHAKVDCRTEISMCSSKMYEDFCSGLTSSADSLSTDFSRGLPDAARCIPRLL